MSNLSAFDPQAKEADICATRHASNAVRRGTLQNIAPQRQRTGVRGRGGGVSRVIAIPLTAGVHRRMVELAA